MMTAIHLAKFIVRVLLLIILLPLVLIWIFARHRVFRHALTKELRNANVPEEHARYLAGEMGIRNLMSRK